MNKIAFIILHYCVIDETIACIESIQENLDTTNYDIIIVDNFSPDGSGKKLVQKYNLDPKITIICNYENLGFAKGCNVGFMYAKKEKQSDFIVLLNNDTLLIQNNFFEIILNEYKNSNFAVLGPDVETPDKIKVNPVRDTLMGEKELNNFIFKIKIRLFLNYLMLESFLISLKKAISSKKSKKSSINAGKRIEDVQLHGCCLIFSPIYIRKFDGLDDRTFLYMEEEILFTKMIKSKMKTVYNPDLKIYHKEDAATNSIVRKSYLKRRFIYKYVLQSSKVLRQVLINK